MINNKTKEALRRAMALCSRSEKCKKDITDRLDSWGITEAADRDFILHELAEHKFIDEARYARAYTAEKHRFNHWGFVKIRMMLRSKGIEASSIERAFEEIDREKYRSVLKEELVRKKGSVKAVNQYDLKGKMMRFALSKGFETDLVYSVIDEITGD